MSYGIKRNMSYGIKRNMSYGIKRNMSYGIKRNMSYGIKRNMSYGTRMGVDCRNVHTGQNTIRWRSPPFVLKVYLKCMKSVNV
jgi:hypothetical protein